MNGGHGRLAIIQAAAVNDHRLGHAAFRVLAALTTYADAEGWCWPSEGRLGEQVGMKQPNVARAVKELAGLGYIEVQAQFHERTGARIQSRYRVLTPISPGYSPPYQDDIGPISNGAVPLYQDDMAPISPRYTNVPNRTIPEERTQENEDISSEPPKRKPKAKPKPDTSETAEVWAYFQQRIQPKAIVCPLPKIHARLKRFGVTGLRQAIDNFATDTWRMKHNAKLGGEWFFKSDEQIQKFLLLEPGGAHGESGQGPGADRTNGGHHTSGNRSRQGFTGAEVVADCAAVFGTNC